MVETFLPVDNLLLYLAIAAMFEALAVYLFQFRQTEGALFLVLCQLCKGGWVASKIVVTLTPDLPGKLIAAKFSEWLPLLLIFFWFEFLLTVSRLGGLRWLRRIVRGCVTLLALVILVDGKLGWYWGAVTQSGNTLAIAFGPAAYALMYFCYALNVLCLALSVRWVYVAKGLRRKQAAALAITPLFNFIGSVLGYALEAKDAPPQLWGWILSGIYITWIFYRWRIYSILPLAQDAVTRTMNDGLLVIDNKGYVVDLNPAAKKIFGGVPLAVGEPFAESVAAWPELAQPTLAAGGAVEIAGPEQRTYDVHSLPLTTPQGYWLGRTILFKDITEQKAAAATIVDQAKALSIVTERERLGRELHDGDGQLWGYVHMQVEAARSLLEKDKREQASTLLEQLAGVTHDVHLDLRESITGLKTTADNESIWQTIAEYMSWFEEKYRIQTVFQLEETMCDALLAATARAQLLRIVQEALTNVRKSARAKRVVVTICQDGDEGEIRIEDDGCGFDVASAMAKKESYGLKIMAERAAEIGARLQVESTIGSGSRILLRFALERRRAELK